MRLFITVFLSFLFVYLNAQIPQVPGHMELGNMKLRITPKGQKIIQEHVNEIYKNEKYLEKMVEKAHLYFPIIEKILKDEGVPDDFKYLCIQESGFQSDAVSSSNAVGYWQFKDFTAREVGLYVERHVDERKHIIYSTEGAAKYLKKNYFYLKNWVYTCQSYQQGRGGTQRSVDQSLFGAEKMDIDKDTYWYVMKFLAHKVAYGQAIKKYKKKHDEALNAVLVPKGTRLSQLASEKTSEEESIREYNTWFRGNRIPELREEYFVMIPGKEGFDQGNLSVSETITIEMKESDPEEIDRIANRADVNPAVRIIIKVNNKKAILANNGDSPVTLALRGGITKDKLLKYNDMIPGEEIIPGMIYYLQKKKNRAEISRHITKEGQTLWEISQRYGVKEKSLVKKNRLAFGEEPKPGRILYLRKKMPKGEDPEYVKLPNKSVEEKEPDPVPAAPDTIPVEINVKNSEDPLDESNSKMESTEADSTSKENLSNQDTINAKAEKDPPEEKSGNDTTETVMHKVTAGETLYSISKKYDVKVEELVDWNNLNDLSLSIGQEIRILKTNQAK